MSGVTHRSRSGDRLPICKGVRSRLHDPTFPLIAQLNAVEARINDMSWPVRDLVGALVAHFGGLTIEYTSPSRCGI